MARILVVYYSRDYPLRSAVEEHLYSFRRYSGHETLYLNLGYPRVPRAFHRLDYDLVVFHNIMLWERMTPELFSAVKQRARFLAERPGPKAVFVQDEHRRTRDIEAFVEEFGIDHVFSCAQPRAWEQLYPNVDRDRVSFHTVLTGYLSERVLESIARLEAQGVERRVDIGYRVRDPLPSNGRHGQLKPRLGDVVGRAASARGLSTDISKRAEDTLFGDDWYRFLLACKYTLGVEGGASVLDPDGSVERCTRAYVAENPEASFDEVEAACFPGEDGGIDYRAISPRHLEACATRTCQILVEGDYNGVLGPGVHYLELKRDFSNVEDVLSEVVRDERRAELVERAHHDIVASGLYTCRGFVGRVLEAVWGDNTPSPRKQTLTSRKAARYDRRTWRLLSIAHRTRSAAERVFGPERVAHGVAAVKRRLGEKETGS